MITLVEWAVGIAGGVFLGIGFASFSIFIADLLEIRRRGKRFASCSVLALTLMLAFYGGAYWLLENSEPSEETCAKCAAR